MKSVDKASNDSIVNNKIVNFNVLSAHAKGAVSHNENGKNIITIYFIAPCRGKLSLWSKEITHSISKEALSIA